MSAKRKRATTQTMLELWRPPRKAGEAVGCLTTTYTFDPGLFDEQCLSRFLEIESDPHREDLAFLLEREMQLGGTYAGVLVDHTQAGVSHSLRWDVLPVRIHGGKQHAKLSLLAWTEHVRLIVASANLTEAGYRSNHEVAVALDASPRQADLNQIQSAVDFLRRLLAFVPIAGPRMPETQRALGLLEQVERQVANWTHIRPSKALRHYLVFTVPKYGGNPDTGIAGFDARGSLEEAVGLCRRHDGSPAEARVASPFFDSGNKTDAATSALCKAMARRVTRRLTISVPALGDPEEEPLRLAAPASLRTTPSQYSAVVDFELLPQRDSDGNRRPWHAKMISLYSPSYCALLTGSSNFTRAGLGIGQHRNAEANVLSVAQRRPYAREPGELDAVWPDMVKVADPNQAKWVGPKSELDEEQRASAVTLPAGFLSASYRAGDERAILLHFDATHLPDIWSVIACGHGGGELLSHDEWSDGGRHEEIVIPWQPVQPPERLRARWPAGEAFWPMNVQDASQLPPPAELAEMSADDMLLILAASDPSAAFRAWTKRRQQETPFDDELDTAVPADLDPLRRYDLRSTFLRRIRTGARVLAQVRENLQRPIWSLQALEWRLEGFIGIRPLSTRLLGDMASADGQVDEAVLALADLLIVLHEVEYQPVEGAVSKAQFDQVYGAFLRSLAIELDGQVGGYRARLGSDMLGFWDRVVTRCQM